MTEVNIGVDGHDEEAEVGEGKLDVHGGRHLADAALAGGYEDHAWGFSGQLWLPIPLEDGPYDQGFWGRESWFLGVWNWKLVEGRN
ncbi:hypothetical protein L484_002040 [Morus notabilis]|uniref:Uncharacterized protein n=1 Tax=Morus notabilis TaxID=981085 RepID=W9QL37_9ROSA|nr:hypothetical protein L484_002040 [Morus notabilis]